MDYVVFILGMFLLAGGLAAIFLHRGKMAGPGWNVAAAAMVLMAMACFTQLIAFPMGVDGVFQGLLAIDGGMALGLLVWFVTPRFSKWARGVFPAVVLVAVAAAVLSGRAEAGMAVAALAAGVGGWAGAVMARRALTLTGRRGIGLVLVSAVAFALITAVCLYPRMVAVAYDVDGDANSLPRLLTLLALALAGMAAVAWSIFLWSAVLASATDDGGGQMGRRGKLASFWIAGAFVALVLYGAWIARWLGNQARDEQVSILLSAVKIGAASLDGDDLAAMKGESADRITPEFIAIHQRLRDIRGALPAARGVYTVGLRSEKFVYLVDGGPLDAADFVAPGQEVGGDVGKWLEVRSGRSHFGGPERDGRGVWFTALVPVLDSARNYSSILGVDYPVKEWLRPLAFRRLAAMGATFSAGCLLLGLFAFHRISTENTLRVARLSERLSDAMEAADFDAWEWYPVRKEIHLGRRMAFRLGYGTASVVISPRTFWRHVHPEDRRALARNLRAGPGEDGRISESEIRMIDAQGEPVWTLLRGRVVQATPTGEPFRVVGTLLNVHDTRRSRLEIEKQRRFAQHVMESVPSGLAVVGGDGLLAYVNRAFVRMAMVEEGMLIGQPIDRLLELPATRDGREGFEGQLRRADGSRLPVQAFRASLSETGLESGSILAVIDLTSSKEAELALLRSRAEARRLALVAQRTDNAVVITDAQGRIEWVNEGFTRISGYRREEVLGRSPGSFLQKPGRENPARALMREKIRSGHGFETEVWNYTKDGVAYLVRIECQPLTENGTLTGFMAIERDVTRERGMESALAEQRGRVDAINRCLLGLGGNYNENVGHLTQLLATLFATPFCAYVRFEGDRRQVVATAGEGSTPDDTTLAAAVASVTMGCEPFSHTERGAAAPGLAMAGGPAGYRVVSVQAIEVEGERRGALVLCFDTGLSIPLADYRTCVALVARAIGREEVIATGRRELDSSLRGLTVEKTRLDVLLSNIDGGVLVEDMENRTILASRGTSGILQQDPDKLVGMSGRELITAVAPLFREPARFVSSYERVLAAGEPVSGEGWEMKNGAIVYRDFVPIREGDTRYGVLWHYRDVTRERRSARLLEAVASVSSTLLSPKMRDTHWGEVLEALGQSAGADRASIYRHHPHLDSGEPAMSQIAQWISGESGPGAIDPALQDLAFGASGLQRWFDLLSRGEEISGLVTSFPESERVFLERQNIRSVVVVPIFAGSSLWGFVGFDSWNEDRRWEKWERALLRSAAANIGLRMVVQQESDALLRARDDARQAALSAEEANRAKSTFLATMSHEIRTPLNAVIGMASLLETTPLNEQQKDYAETILRSSHFLLELINDVLDYSRIESGRIDLDATVFSLADLCQEGMEVVRAAAMGKELAMTCRLSPDLPPRVLGDPGRLRQILVNLLGNAVKFTRQGSVSLEVDGSLLPDGRWSVIFEIKDTGIGISSAALDRLFEPFIQGDSTTTRRFGGSGLGLAISRRLAQLMDGDISVESEPGKGSTFTVNVCLTQAAQVFSPRAGNSIVAPTTGAREDAAQADEALFGQLRVVVAEDNPNNQKVIRLLLRRLGVEMEMVENGLEALLSVQANPPDVLFLDIQMPVMDGLESCRRILALGLPCPPVIVALTANAFKEDREAALEAGMDHYLAKPVTLAKLRELLQQVCRDRGITHPMPDAPPALS